MAKVFGANVVCGIFLILLIINNFSNCVTTELEETERYHVVHSQLPDLGSYVSIIKLREKRETPTDLKNQYQSVTQNTTDAKTIPPQPNTPQNPANINATANSNVGSAERNATDTSVVVPYNVNDRSLLGVNGTGQRKDMTDKSTTKPTIVSDAIQPVNSNGSTKYPKKVLAAMPALNSESAETSEEKIIDTIDVAEDETVKALENRNFTVNQTTDYHNYYNSTIYVDKVQADEVWKHNMNVTYNSMLSQSHRRAMTVELSFDFPFYGHPVRNITVATGGFLYTGEYVHSWLAATQYVAPLMANFDPGLTNNSFVRLNDNGTAFTVVWENVSLQDKPDVGHFTFSTTLHKNGDIVFTYFSVPITISAIQDDKHPVKVGLSDAYIIDKVVFVARRKTIFEYHRVNFANSDITNSTIIYLKALPTCLAYTDCAACINHDTSFDCTWCPTLNRCSTGTDRKKQEWLQKGCDKTQISDILVCPALGQTGNNANQTQTSDTQVPSSNKSNENHGLLPHQIYPNREQESSTIAPTNSEPLNKSIKAAINDSTEPPKGVGLAFGFLVPICLVITLLLWIVYAYRNPHTKSGQLLIQYRPSQWSWRRGEARYTAATIHM